METLIIESYEGYGISDGIKDSKGNFLHLKELIPKVLSEKSWNIGRKARNVLPQLKDIGDRSAHDRRFNAHRQDIDKLISDLRTVTQELVYLAGLK